MRAGAGDAGGMRGGSGGGGATWRGGNKPARGRGAATRVLGWHVAQLRAARVLGWHVAQLRAARGGGCMAHGRRGRRGRCREETEEPGLEEDDED
jgi:hypothetical protein